MAATTTFADLGVSAKLVAKLADQGFTEPFPIQTATIEAALAGRDICGKAPTGSGKTLAFGVPVIDLSGAGTSWRPRSLILAPTRELATQIKDELEPLAKARGRSIFTVFGGTNIERDIRRLEKGVDILVACPGRLEDLIARRCCELRDVDRVVVDEADRMADMGFLPAVKRILDQTTDDRHTMLYSATLDGDVDALIKRYQRDPLTFEIDEQAGDVGDVEHSWFLVQPADRIDSAVTVLKGYYSSIVFCRTRRGCDRVARMFGKKGLQAVAIHGDRSQGQREKALRDFTTGKAQVLVATDVAARGIHVDNVSLVMHYDPAGSDKDYIHRSGRTGRAGQDGRVISMVVEDKKKLARQLQKDLGMRPGFDSLDDADLPAEVERPTPTIEPEPQTDRSRDRKPRDNRDDRRGKNTRDDGDRKPRGNRKPRGEQSDQSRDRKPRDNRDDRPGNRRGKNTQDDRPKSRRGNRDDRPGNRRGKNTQDDRSKSRRGGPAADGDARRRPRRAGANDWYPPGYHDDDPRDSRKPSRSRGRGPTGPSRSGERDERPAGGSGTAKRKSRAAKGRHADKTTDKNKGKRRRPRHG